MVIPICPKARVLEPSSVLQPVSIAVFLLDAVKVHESASKAQVQDGKSLRAMSSQCNGACRPWILFCETYLFAADKFMSLF